MKKIIKILGFTLLSIIILLYFAFLFVLPNAIDLNKFKPEIQKIAKEQTNLTLNFDNPQISVTPLLSAGIKAENIKITLPDESELLKADNLITRVSLPHLLLLTVQISKAEINNPSINIDIIENKAFKAVAAFEEILNKEEEKIEENLQTAEKPLIDPSNIKIMVPALKLTNYNAQINDLQTSNVMKLRGDEFILGYRNGKTISVKTIAELFINETKNITANINIDTMLPQSSKLDKEDDKAQRVEIPFVNPVSMYMEYDLKTNIDSKIKIREKNNKVVSKGHLYIDNFTLKLANMQLPESKLHIDTNGTMVVIDSDLFLTKEEKLSLLGMVNYANKPAMDLKINSNKIHLDNVISLVKATLDALHIKHELQPLKGEGYFTTDTYIKTDFKKLTSNGNITIKDCILKDTKNNYTIAKVNSIISLDNSILKFIDTAIEVADTTFTLDGSINEKSYADLILNMEKMPIQKAFNMFAPSDLKKAYIINSGNIDLTANIKGKLKNAIANAKLSLSNLSLTDKINKITYNDSLLSADFSSDFKKLTGNLKNIGFNLNMNGANVNCENFTVNLTDKDISISPSNININNSTNIDLSGEIKNYTKNPIFDFNVNGELVTKDIKQLLGEDLAIFINTKGKLPIKANISGDQKKQVLTASIEANKDNFITPININSVLDKDTIIKTVVDFKGDRLKIKDTGFFIKNISKDPRNENKTITTYKEIIGIDGTITKLNTSNPNINLIKVTMPESLTASIHAFPQSKLNTKGNMYIFGNLSAPRIRGDFNIWNLNIPELLITMERANATFESKDLDITITNLLANGSDFNVIMNADLNPSKNFTIKNLNLNSNLTDADKLMKVAELTTQSLTPANKQTTSISTTNSQPADIPVCIKDGNIDIKQIKTGNIILDSTTSKLSMSDNVLYLNNLITNGFKGKIKGDVSMNIVTSLIKANLKGKDLDVEKTLLDAAAMKDTLSGTMDFDANISLKGSTYEEQMKTLKGDVNFTMKNGDLGPFGKLENLILAENIRESVFFQSTIGTILNSLLSFDTTSYNELKGNLSFNDGITDIKTINSTGDVMSTYIFGNFDLLKNTIDIKLRGRLGSQVSDSMGPLALLNPINLVKATPGMSLVLGKMFALFCEEVTTDELSLIPTLGKDISDTNTTKFQVVVRGDVAKPLTLVKSFKWLALKSEIEGAKTHLNTIPENTILPKEITTLDKEQIKTQVKEQAKKQVEDTINTILTEEDKQNIEKGKETVTKLKDLFSNKDETKNKLKEQAEKAKQNALNKLKEQALQSLNTTTETQNSEISE